MHPLELPGMLDPQILARLKLVPMIAEMPPHVQEHLARAAVVQQVQRGQVIFKQWDIARGFYMLLSGEGQLQQQQSDGTVRVLAVVQAGQYFNEAALDNEVVEQASFVIGQPGYLLMLNRAAYVQALAAPVPQAPSAPPPRPTAPSASPPAPQTSLPLPDSAVPSPGKFTGPGIADSGAGMTVPSPSATVQRPAPTSPAQAARSFGDKNPAWLVPDEQILLQTRRHWWAAVRRMWLAGVMVILLLIAWFIADQPFVRFALMGLMLILPGGLFIYNYADWRNDWLIVTNQRVLRVENQLGRLRTETIEVGLDSVQGISASLPNGDFIARLLNYGNVVISTAGSAGNVSMNYVPRPEQVKAHIFRQRADLVGSDARVQQPADRSGQQGQGGGLFAMRFVNRNGDTVYRRHVMVWLRTIFWPLIMVGLSFLVLLFGGNLAFLRQAGLWVNLVALGCVFIGAIWLFLADWDWRNDLYIISTDVVTLLQRSPFFLQYREDQILLVRIHNIEAETRGLLHSLMDYGDVRLLLLGDDKPKVFHDVPSPTKVREEISKRQRAAAERAQTAEEERRFGEFMRRMQDSQGAQNLGTPPVSPR
jgi:hypothetical protein